MNYDETVSWLFSQLANYQKQGEIAYKPGLQNILALLKHIGNPQNQFKSIHIAGTNGKGSTAHILTSIGIENGYKVGLFTSPHIKDFRERIKVNGEMITPEEVVAFVNTNKSFFETLKPSFFEITTALAFQAFANANCDIAIIETGLGGRLDSTNVLKPEIAVITNIGLDHTQILGDTLAKIAKEKAGIIKLNTPVVIGEILPETRPIFEDTAHQLNAELHISKPSQFKTDLLGAYQQINCSLAWNTIQILKLKGWYFDDQKTAQGLQKVGLNSGFRGRLEIIAKNPTTIIDASHNIDGVKLLFKELENLKYNQLHAVFGSSSDKNYKESAAYFPKTAKYYFTTFESERAVSEKELIELGNQYTLDYSVYKSPLTALESAKSAAHADDLVLVFGSFYILEKII